MVGERTVYCIVPRELAAKLHEPLRRHFRDEPNVEVIVEQRGAERRSGRDRRGERSGRETPARAAGAERRLIRGPMERRLGERRAAQVPVRPPGSLPRRLQRFADRLAFVARALPSSEEAEDRDTARLVMRYQAGDEGVFSELYLRYFDRVYAYLRLLVRDYHEAEDLAQQAFAKVAEALPRYERRRQPFRAWLFTVARNEAISHLRRQGRITVAEPEEIDRRRAEQGEAEEDELPILGWIADRDLMLFVERLPEAQRQVLGLRYLLDLDNAQIAAVMNRSKEEVKALHYRAVNTLRERLASIGRTSADSKPASATQRFKQAEVLRHRRFALWK